MEVYINHSGSLHKLKYEIEISNDRKRKSVSKYFLTHSHKMMIRMTDIMVKLIYVEDLTL